MGGERAWEQVLIAFTMFFSLTRQQKLPKYGSRASGCQVTLRNVVTLFSHSLPR